MFGLRRTWWTAMVLAVAVGCVDVDGELRSDGSASFRYTYGPPRHATFESERARLGSEHVTVVKIEPGEQVTATLTVRDLTKLSLAEAFADVQTEVDLEGRRLRLSLPGFDAKTRRDVLADPATEEKAALRLSVVLPGTATDAAPASAATVDVRRVTWALSIAEYARAGERVELGVGWAAPPAEQAAAHSM